MVSLFVFKIKETQFSFLKKISYFLTDKEKEDSFRFKKKKDCDLSLIHKYLTKKTLANYLKKDIKNVILRKDKEGRPFLIDNNNFIDFNISHSGDQMVLAVNNKGRVGVDIEKHKDIDFIEIAQNFFHKEELKYICEKPELIKKRFYKIWTLKESYLKALGTGLKVKLSNFYFKIEKNDSIKLYDFNKEWHLQFVEVIPGYELSLCSEGDKSVNIRFLDINKF